MLALREGQSQELFRELICPMTKDAFPPELLGIFPKGGKEIVSTIKKTEKDKALKLR